MSAGTPAPEGRPRILLSGFEPFDGATRNESWEAVRVAADLLGADGALAVETLLLPVEFGRAAELLLAAVRAQRPALVIATGLAAGRGAITPERVAINVQDARIPDAAGRSPVDEPCVAGGPAAHFTSLPIKAMARAAAVAGAPASISQTAGTYVCNDVFYRLQHALATEPGLQGVRGGFVHVPAQAAVGVPLAGRALALMASVALTAGADARIAGGAEE